METGRPFANPSLTKAPRIGQCIAPARLRPMRSTKRRERPLLRTLTLAFRRRYFRHPARGYCATTPSSRHYNVVSCHVIRR